jgi:putative sigma-54 modulation protein
MQLTITGRHFDITPHLRQHVNSRFERLGRFDHHVIAGELVLFKDRASDVAEGKIHLGHEIFAAKGQGNDMYVAVNDLFDKLQKQLQRYEDKVKNHKHRSAARGR